MHQKLSTVVLLALTLTVSACAKKVQPVPAMPAPPPSTQQTAPPLTQPPQRVADDLPVAPQPIGEDSISNRSLDDLNRDSPLKPAFFALDSADLDDAGRAVVNANADVLRKYPTWVVTIEGHTDERGTAE